MMIVYATILRESSRRKNTHRRALLLVLSLMMGDGVWLNKTWTDFVQ